MFCTTAPRSPQHENLPRCNNQNTVAQVYTNYNNFKILLCQSFVNAVGGIPFHPDLQHDVFCLHVSTTTFFPTLNWHCSRWRLNRPFCASHGKLLSTNSWLFALAIKACKKSNISPLNGPRIREAPRLLVLFICNLDLFVPFGECHLFIVDYRALYPRDLVV